MQWLDDGAAIHTLGKQPNSQINNNLIENIIGTTELDSSARTHQYGIYLDNGTSELTVTNNIVNNASSSLYFHDNEINNVSNNYFLEAYKKQITCGGNLVEVGNTFNKCVIYYTKIADLFLLSNNLTGTDPDCTVKQSGFNLYFTLADLQTT